MQSSFDFHPAAIFLERLIWTQTLHTQRNPRLGLQAKMGWREGRFLIREVGDISHVSVELVFMRGEHDWKTPGAPLGSIGYIQYFGEEQSDEFGHSPAFLSGGCSVPEGLYDDLWFRTKTPSAASSVIVRVGPTEFDGFEDTTWDRRTNSLLFITEAEFIFRNETNPALKYDAD